MDDLSDFDDWVRREIAPLGLNEQVMAWKLLERYYYNASVGPRVAFGWCVMEASFMAGIAIAEQLSVDNTVDVLYRIDAMIHLILCSEYYKSIELDIDTIRSILTSDTITREQSIKMVKLVYFAASNKLIWSNLKREIIGAVSTIYHTLGGRLTVRLRTQRSCLTALHDVDFILR